MSNYAQRHPSKYISAGQFDGKPFTGTIAQVHQEELAKPDGEAKVQSIVTFAEKTKAGTAIQWVLNATNDQLVSAMFGEEDNDWIGKRVTLAPEADNSPVNDTGLCIRVIGSPDIKREITAMVKLSRKRPAKRTLVPTKTGANEPVFDGTDAFDDVDTHVG